MSSDTYTPALPRGRLRRPDAEGSGVPLAVALGRTGELCTIAESTGSRSDVAAAASLTTAARVLSDHGVRVPGWTDPGDPVLVALEYDDGSPWTQHCDDESAAHAWLAARLSRGGICRAWIGGRQVVGDPCPLTATGGVS